MSKVCLVLLAVLASSVGSLSAEEERKFELFTGFAYMRARDVDVNLLGWDVGVVGYMNNWLGIGGAVSGVYGSTEEFAAGRSVDIDLDLHTVAVGPVVTTPRDQSVSGFLRVLVGYARAGAGAGVPELGVNVGVSTVALAILGGGGIDFRLSDRLSIRAPQVEFVHTRSEGEGSTDFRVSGGPVFRF